MKSRIIIARHGNTFEKGQVPTRVGSRTDLPLVESQKSILIGKFLKNRNLLPDLVYSSPLKRTLQTAEIALDAMGLSNVKINLNEQLREVDYGPDENHTEDAIKLRLGKLYLQREGYAIETIAENALKKRGEEIIQQWDTDAIVPDGWKINPEDIKASWQRFADNHEKNHYGKTALLFSSNGIIRFAPYLTGNFSEFSKRFKIKVATGNICIFEKDLKDAHWTCVDWNITP